MHQGSFTCILDIFSVFCMTCERKRVVSAGRFVAPRRELGGDELGGERLCLSPKSSAHREHTQMQRAPLGITKALAEVSL